MEASSNAICEKEPPEGVAESVRSNINRWTALVSEQLFHKWETQVIPLRMHLPFHINGPVLTTGCYGSNQKIDSKLWRVGAFLCVKGQGRGTAFHITSSSNGHRKCAYSAEASDREPLAERLQF